MCDDAKVGGIRGDASVSPTATEVAPGQSSRRAGHLRWRRAMAELVLQGSEQALMREMGINDGDVERRKKYVGFAPEDVPRILAVRDVVRHHAEELTTVFFNHLAGFEEARPLMSNRDTLDRVRRLKQDHLVGLVGGEY